MIGWLMGLPFRAIAREVTKAITARENAKTESERIAADVAIEQLKARQSALISEQSHWATRWIRPAIALPVTIYVWKLVLWDTVLGWGVTPNPGEFVNWIVVVVIGAYFLTRPLERGRR